jgi:hypothetical protein
VKISTARASHPSRMEREIVLGLQPPPKRRGARLLRSPHSEEHEFQRVTANLPIRSHLLYQKSSPAFAGRNSEEAATPGQASTRHRVSGNPPAVHPREPPETPGIFRCSSRRLRLDRACVGAMCPIAISRSSGKSPPVVTKLWTMSIFCGKCRKTGLKPEDNTCHRGTENTNARSLDFVSLRSE